MGEAETGEDPRGGDLGLVGVELVEPLIHLHQTDTVHHLQLGILRLKEPLLQVQQVLALGGVERRRIDIRLV